LSWTALRQPRRVPVGVQAGARSQARPRGERHPSPTAGGRWRLGRAWGWQTPSPWAMLAPVAHA